jgi:hypothetical protein
MPSKTLPDPANVHTNIIVVEMFNVPDAGQAYTPINPLNTNIL